MAEEAVLDININAGDSPRTLGGLRKQIEQLNQELEQVGLHGDDFNRLSSELTAANREVKNLELSFEALDTEQQASELGSVAGAVGDITSAFILLGGESETMQQIAGNIQKAIGVSIAFKGAIEGVASARKLLNSLDKESNIIKVKDLVIGKARRAGEIAMIAITKTATITQRVFNTVLKANPIGLIVTAIGLLITGIIALVKNFDVVIESLKDFGKFLLKLIDPFGLLIGLTGDLRTEEEKSADQRRKQTKELGEQTAQRIKEIEELRVKEAAAHKNRLTEYDLQIARLEAEGKSSFKVRLEMLEDILAEQKAVLKANQDKLQSWIDYYTSLAAIRGQDEETFKASLKAQGTDLDDLLQRSLDNQQVLKDAIFTAETDIKALKKKRADEQKTISDQATAEQDKARELAHQKELKRIEDEANVHADLILEIEKLESEYFDSLLTNQQQEENAVRDKYFNLITQAEQFGEDTAILEAAREQALLDVRNEFREKEQEAKDEADQLALDKEQQARDIRAAAIQEQANKVIDSAQNVLNIVESINSIAFSKEVARIKQKDANGEKLSQNEIKRLKRDEAAKKAFAIAEIAINTARGVAEAVAAGAGVPFPGNIFAILSGVAAVLSGVAQANAIINQPSPTFGGLDTSIGGGFGGGGRGNDLSQTPPDTDLFETGSTLIDQTPQKVYVLEQDITGVQTEVAEIEQQATFG